jgi:hypothetical protein
LRVQDCTHHRERFFLPTEGNLIAFRRKLCTTKIGSTKLSPKSKASGSTELSSGIQLRRRR